MPELDFILVFLAQTSSDTVAASNGAASSGQAIPTWGWITIVSVLGSTVATLAGVTWRTLKSTKDEVSEAKSETIKRADAERERLEDTNGKLSDLLERAIRAFEVSKTAADQQVEKHNQLISELKELREEVRRVGEKINA